jgi:hypothetical protein
MLLLPYRPSASLALLACLGCTHSASSGTSASTASTPDMDSSTSPETTASAESTTPAGTQSPSNNTTAQLPSSAPSTNVTTSLSASAVVSSVVNSVDGGTSPSSISTEPTTTAAASGTQSSEPTPPSPPLPPRLKWTREGSSQQIIEEVWGSGPNDIYGVGRSGVIVHSTGDGTWVKQTSGTGSNLSGIWGSGPNDIYVSVDSNFILHSTGDGEWEKQTYDPGVTFDNIWGLDADHVYALGAGVVRRSSTEYWGDPERVNRDGDPSFAIWGSSPNDLYIATSLGAASPIMHSSGDGKWVAQANAPMDVTANDIWGADANHIYVAAGSSVYFSSGDGNWSKQLDAPSTFGAVWTVGVEAAFACTFAGQFYRSNGAGTWDTEGEHFAEPVGLSDCLAIWGTPDNIYLGTAGGIYHGVPE